MGLQLSEREEEEEWGSFIGQAEAIKKK